MSWAWPKSSGDKFTESDRLAISFKNIVFFAIWKINNGEVLWSEFIPYGTNNINSQVLSLSGDNQGRLGIRMEHSILIFTSLGGTW